MKNLIKPYLEDHETAWAPTTLKSEKSRLNKLAPHLNLSPKDLHQLLKEQGKAPYTIKTIFIRLADMEKWGKLEPKFQAYIEKHQNRFKHAYQKTEVRLSFEEASERLGALPEPYRSMGMGLLKSGLRISEAYKVEDGKVEGKGGKVRKVFGDIIKTSVPRSTFSRKLKAVGLTPHTLRKLCATRLADKGATAADLCKVFGWTDIKTAYQYLQGKDDERLQALMETSEERP
jgi:integrase